MCICHHHSHFHSQSLSSKFSSHGYFAIILLLWSVYEMFPQTHMLRVWDPDVVLFGEMFETLGDEACWMEVGSLGEGVFEGYLAHGPLLLLYLYLANMR